MAAPDPRPHGALRWYRLRDVFRSEAGTVHLREPARADLSRVRQQLRAGRYPHPFVFDDGEMLRLHFSLRYVQSAMRRDDPDALALAYTRKMMAFLLFQPQPRHVVVVGMGGGSLSKFCYRHLPRTRITTIELDARVIGCAELFQVPPPNARMRIEHADARDYFAGRPRLADAVLIDGCDRHGIADVFCEPAFYRDLDRHLAPGGMLVVNLIGGGPARRRLRRLLAERFDARPMELSVDADGNRILFAFKSPRPTLDWAALQARAAELQLACGLDFPAFARQLSRHDRA
ncbi:MAG TPA: hypothetical protein VGE57_03300 [Solimonas sp.]